MLFKHSSSLGFRTIIHPPQASEQSLITSFKTSRLRDHTKISGQKLILTGLRDNNLIHSFKSFINSSIASSVEKIY